MEERVDRPLRRVRAQTDPSMHLTPGRRSPNGFVFYDRSVADYGGMSARVGSLLPTTRSPVAAACAPMKNSFPAAVSPRAREADLRSDLTAGRTTDHDQCTAEAGSRSASQPVPRSRPTRATTLKRILDDASAAQWDDRPRAITTARLSSLHGNTPPTEGGAASDTLRPGAVVLARNWRRSRRRNAGQTGVRLANGIANETQLRHGETTVT